MGRAHSGFSTGLSFTSFTKSDMISPIFPSPGGFCRLAAWLGKLRLRIGRRAAFCEARV
jgi:hypothetical protein